MTKKSRKKLKYFEKERALRWNKKYFFIIFKGVSVVQNCLRHESAPLISPPNAPCRASLYRPQGTPLGVSSDESSVASSIALTNIPSSAPSITMSNASFLSLSYALSVALSGEL